MKRGIYYTAVSLFWLAMLVIGYQNWPGFVAFFEPQFKENARGMAVVFVAVTGGFLVLVQAYLSDIFMHEEVKEKEIDPETRRREAEAAALAALKKGDKATALKLYERVGLYHSALQIAEEVRDRQALLRLYTKLGRYERARKIQIDEGDFEGAAFSSVLMGEIPASRQYFRKAAEMGDARKNPRRVADLWNRAQELHRAAVLYEEAGELDQAAECYDLMGDAANAKRTAEQFRAMKAFEAKAGRGPDPRRFEEIKADKARSAALLKDMGDFFGAGELYRGADQLEDAAKCFERVEEWERAARCHESIDRKERAAAVRRKIQPKKYEAPEVFSQTLMNLPSLESSRADSPSEDMSSPSGSSQVAFAIPGALPQSPAFRSLAANAPVFVTVAGIVAPAGGGDGFGSNGGGLSPFGRSHTGLGGGRTALNPEIGIAQEQLAQHLRRGRVRDAARAARQAEDPLLSAVLFEQAGDYLTAAESYKQIGRYREAADCMDRHGDYLEAARLCVAVKNHGAAIRHLLRGISHSPASHYPVALAEVYLGMKARHLADRVFRRFVATGRLSSEGQAEVAWRFSRLFEDAGHDDLALNVVRAMRGAGYRGEALEERAKLLALNLGGDASVEPLTVDNVILGSKPFRPQSGKNESGSTTRERGQGLGKAIEPENTRTRDRHEMGSPGSIHNQATMVSSSGLPGRADTMESDFIPPTDVGPRLIFLRDDENTGRNIDTGVSLFGKPVSGADGDEDPFSPANRYELKNELGRGGMGVIFEATDRVLNRPVALKFILKGEATTREEFSQFLLEARAIARLSHPNIVTIYDIGMMKSKHYIAMELVTGGSLASRLRERGKFPLAEALRLFVEIGRGLQAAHEQGIVHRDVKPGNILLSEKDTVRLVDFGLATLQGKSNLVDAAEVAMEKKFRHAGTPGFMAPEQIRGAEPLPAADIYALGIIFYVMLTGEPPHKSAAPASVNDVLAFQLKGIMPKLRDLRPDAPEAFEHLYRYCTVANPSDRYQSVDQFLKDAEKYLKAMT